MAHLEQNIFCTKIRALFPAYFFRKKVLDIGSMDINGCNRPLFWFCRYAGLDLAPGRNVTIICEGHLLQAPDAYYDTIISTECGEHDKYWEKTIANAMRMLKPGGLMIYTCATDGRLEHGTRRTDTYSSPFTTDYYRNLNEQDLRSIEGFNDTWAYCRFEIDNSHHDLRFFGIKKGIAIGKFAPSKVLLILTLFRFFYQRRINDFRNAISKI